MDRNRRLRMGRTPTMGALAAAGVVGAALLAGPLASSQAEQAFPLGLTYHNGGFCYQNPAGQENTYRLVFSEPEYKYNPESTAAVFTWKVQKWDSSSNQYQDEREAFESGPGKAELAAPPWDQGFYGDPNFFCKNTTEVRADHDLGGDVYSYGEYTSTRTVDPAPQSPPQP
jgi:hypothetical protein